MAILSPRFIHQVPAGTRLQPPAHATAPVLRLRREKHEDERQGEEVARFTSC